MSRKRVTTMRLGDADREALAALSAAWGQNESEIVRRLIPTGPWLDAIRLVPQKRGDPIIAPRRLMADGLRKLMATSANGIKAEYLDAITGPDEVARLFVEWQDGLSTFLGLVGPLGNRFVLVEGEYGFLPEPNPDWVAPQIQELVKVALADLGSPELPKRIEAGARLVQRLDLSADRVALLGRAISGDVVALEELTATLEADPIGKKGGANG